MAITGNKSGSFNGTYPKYATPYIFWSYDQSIPNNNTVLTATLKVKREKTGSSTNKSSTPWSITIGGTKTSGTTSFKISSVSAGEYITIGSASKTITHNSEGSCNAVSISASIDISGTTLGTGSVSTSVTPSTIPRASTPTLSVSSVAMGSSVTIYTNRVSSNFTHIIYFSFSGISWRTISSGVGTSISWTPPVDLASQIPNGVSGTCTIHCETYNNGTHIGTKTITLTLTVPSSVAPSISSISVSAGNSVVPTSWGMYLQGKSQLKVVTNASGSYGSSITSYKVTGIDNNTYWSSNFTSGVLQISGTRTITVTVTDSRGRTATKTTTYTCVAYSNPSISTATVTRCNADGTENEEGEYVKYSFWGSIPSLGGKNGQSVKIGYRVTGSGNYTYKDVSINVSNVVFKDTTFSVDNSYDVIFYVADYFSSSSIVRNIPTGFTLLDFRNTGKGMAIGKVSEKDAFEVGMPTEFLGDVDLGNNIVNNPTWNTYTTNNEDYNNMTKSGTYYMGTGCSNAPEDASYVRLFVSGYNSQGDILQIAGTVTSSRLFVRTSANRVWGSWKALPNVEYLGTGKNLDNITNVGQYGIYGTNTNGPTTSIAVLEVVKYSPDWILQRVTTISAEPKIYERCYHSGSTWGAWFQTVNAGVPISGAFNQGSWNAPTRGLVTQITDNSGSQHSVIVGLKSDGATRLYGMDLVDNDDYPMLRLYAGSNYFELNYSNCYTPKAAIDNLTSTNVTITNLIGSGINAPIIASGASNAYFGSGGEYTDKTTNLRGNNVRLYAHSGGGVYLGYSGSTAVTSDENLKDIYEIDDKYIDFFNNLKPITYIYKDKGHRNHMGFGARQVEQALTDAGLTTEEFAGVLKDEDVTISADEMGTEEDVHFDELYSLRYEEFIALNTYMIQKQAKQIEEQNNLIADLKARIEILEKQADIC